MVLRYPDADLMRLLSRRLREVTGIHYSDERYEELHRRLEPCFNNLAIAGQSQNAFLGDWTPEMVDSAVQCLTVPETCFFRDSSLWSLLSSKFLPQAYRRVLDGQSDKINIWSAACCTGEEPYTIAMLIDQVLGHRAAGAFNIVGTDINKQYLNTARKALYSKWSMRATPADFKSSYFHEHASQSKFELKSQIRDSVRFEFFNLVSNEHPIRQPAVKFDLIICRNVLIYFSDEQSKQAISLLASHLVDDGWLILSPHDLWRVEREELEVHIDLEVVILKKKSPGSPSNKINVASVQAYTAKSRTTEQVAPKAIHSGQPAAQAENAVRIPDPSRPSENPGQLLAKAGKYAEAAQALSRQIASDRNDEDVLALLIQCLVNSGDEESALRWLDRSIQIHPLKASFYYTKGNLLEEKGNREAAAKCLAQAVFLDPNFVMAHFALFNIAKKTEKRNQVEVHLRNVVRLLERHRNEDVLPEGDGLTASQLLTIVKSQKEYHQQ